MHAPGPGQTAGYGYGTNVADPRTGVVTTYSMNPPIDLEPMLRASAFMKDKPPDALIPGYTGPYNQPPGITNAHPMGNSSDRAFPNEGGGDYNSFVGGGSSFDITSYLTMGPSSPPEVIAPAPSLPAGRGALGLFWAEVDAIPSP